MFLWFLSLMVACVKVVPLAHLMMRPNQLFEQLHWNVASHSLDHKLTVTLSLLPHLEKAILIQGVLLKDLASHSDNRLAVMTDASFTV